jgi:hypothetical protein
MNHSFVPACRDLALVHACAPPLAMAAQDCESFEARQSHPVDLQGSVLLAVNSPKGSLAVFDLDRRSC